MATPTTIDQLTALPGDAVQTGDLILVRRGDATYKLDTDNLPSGGGGGTVDVVSNVATARILGRTTAGSGDSEELTAAQVRTLLNVEDGATAGGTTVTFFQVEDDGTTGQATTTSAADLAGMWGTASLTSSSFSWNGTTGVLTVDADGVVEFDIKVTGYQTARNRHELHIEIYKNGSTVIVADDQYASRNTTQRKGSAYINGFKVNAVDGDTFRVRVFHVGVAATIGDANVAGQTYFSAKHYA